MFLLSEHFITEVGARTKTAVLVLIQKCESGIGVSCAVHKPVYRTFHIEIRAFFFFFFLQADEVILDS